MRAALIAGLLYFAGALALGFVLGTLRVLFLEPRTGPLLAVLVELPFMLAATWALCGRLTAIFAVEPRAISRLTMGVSAFTLLLMAEAALYSLLNGRPAVDFLASLGQPAGAAGLAGQLVFAGFPLIQMVSERRL